MNTFFTSDQHYGHKNICRFADRPFGSVEEMDRILIDNHNNTVGQGDDVWFIGDFSFHNQERTERILKQLNGKKRLILGNHDKQFAKGGDKFLRPQLFDGIYSYKEIRVEGQSIVLFHYGTRVWNKSHHGSWLLYGHSHGSLPPHNKSVDVGVDDKNITSEYRPYSFAEVKRFMDGRETEPVDHHK